MCALPTYRLPRGGDVPEAGWAEAGGGRVSVARTSACRSLQIRYGRHHRHRLERGGGQAQEKVEGPGLLRDRVHQQASDADGVSRLDDPVGRILKQCAAQSAPLVRAGDRQTTQHDHRDWVRHVALESPRCCVWRHGAGCQCGVGNDLARIDDDECARGAADLIGQGPPPQPVIEGHDAAVEGPEYVLGSQRFRRSDHAADDQSLDQGGGVRMVRFKRSLGFGGASSRARNFE